MPSAEARRRTSTRISENLHKTKLQHWINLNIRENLASWSSRKWRIWSYCETFIHVSSLWSDRRNLNIFVHFSPSIICTCVSVFMLFQILGSCFFVRIEFCFMFPLIKNIYCDCFWTCLFSCSVTIYSPQKKTLYRKMRLFSFSAAVRQCHHRAALFTRFIHTLTQHKVQKDKKTILAQKVKFWRKIMAY